MDEEKQLNEFDVCKDFYDGAIKSELWFVTEKKLDFFLFFKTNTKYQIKE